MHTPTLQLIDDPVEKPSAVILPARSARGFCVQGESERLKLQVNEREEAFVILLVGFVISMWIQSEAEMLYRRISTSDWDRTEIGVLARGFPVDLE